MDCRPQNPEFRNDPENIHPLISTDIPCTGSDIFCQSVKDHGCPKIENTRMVAEILNYFNR